MALTRRSFLRGTVAAAGVALSAELVRYLPKERFNPNDFYGDYISTTDELDEPLVREFEKVLTAQIKQVVPPKYRHKIKWVVWDLSDTPPRILGWENLNTVGWKYSPDH